MIKSLVFQLTIVIGSVLAMGCNSPEVSTEEEAARSMEESMEIDTMAETEAGGGAGADTDGAATDP